MWPLGPNPLGSLRAGTECASVVPPERPESGVVTSYTPITGPRMLVGKAGGVISLDTLAGLPEMANKVHMESKVLTEEAIDSVCYVSS